MPSNSIIAPPANVRGKLFGRRRFDLAMSRCEHAFGNELPAPLEGVTMVYGIFPRAEDGDPACLTLFLRISDVLSFFSKTAEVVRGGRIRSDRPIDRATGIGGIVGRTINWPCGREG